MKEMEGTESFLHAIHLSIHPPTQAILFLVVGVCEFDQSLTQHLELYNTNNCYEVKNARMNKELLELG